MSRIVVSKNLDELSANAVAEFVRIANDAIEQRGFLLVALSGGSTPKALFQKLISADINWSQTFFFFGDERNVPADDEQSNFRMADENLFRPLNIRLDRIFRWKTELDDPDEVAKDFCEQIVFGFAKAHSDAESNEVTGGFGGITFGIYDGRFDLVLLGMGADGHTASLFPRTTALNETEKLAVANWVPQLDSWRYTLTFPVINNARNVMFLVAGADKSETLKDVLEGERQPHELPSQSVQPTDGELFWFVDEAAASLLDKH